MAAVNGRADGLVTHNVRDFEPATRLFGVRVMLPRSVKTAAARLAKADGVSLNQFIAAAVAEKVGVIETAREFLEKRAGEAKPQDLLKYLRKAGREQPAESDRR